MLPQDLQKQYDTSRRRAEAEAAERVREAYAAVPELKGIDDEMMEVAFNMGIELVKAADRAAVKRAAEERLLSLRLRRSELLRAAHISEEGLKPRYGCEMCGDSGYLESGELCPCVKARLAGRMYASSGIGENAGFDRFDDSVFKDTEQLKRTRRAAEICRQYAKALEINGANGLLLMGETGLGKTFLLDCIAREVMQGGLNIKKYTAYNLIDAQLRAVRQREAGPELTGAELLLIDDLGTEPMIPGITIETLFAVINERQFAKKATVIATNLDRTELFNRYGDRIFSRLFASREYAVITLKGKDLRV